MAEFTAPNGGEIQGTSETVLGASGVTFGDTPTDYDHDGGSKMFWDTSTTETIEGVSMFTCDGGDDWLAHHLIPEGCEPMSAEDLAVLGEEDRIGYALRAARELHLCHDALRPEDQKALGAIIRDLTHRYGEAKKRSIELVQAHIAAHPVVEEEDA